LNVQQVLRAPRPSKAEEISERLADAIVSGEILPGERLEEGPLALRFGASRTPVREALRLLESLGLVKRQTHRGVIAAKASEEDIRHLFEVTEELAVICARFAATRMPARDKTALRRFHEKMAAMVAADDADAYGAASNEFMRRVSRGAGNPELEAALGSARRRLAVYSHIQFAIPNRMASSHAAYGGLVDAILAGAPADAERAMRRHIGASRDALTPILAGRRPPRHG
jgi:DNA-binding GntR family transcriptional regulator